MNSPDAEEPSRTSGLHTRPRPDGRAVMLTLAGLAIAYSPMWGAALADAVGFTGPIEGPASSIVVNALAVATLLAYLVVVERRRLASIGLRRPSARDLEWALYLFGICMAWQWVVMTFFPSPPSQGTESITSMPVVVVLALVVSSAVFEEILYRGYPIERLAELTGRAWFAFALTIPLFIAPHVVFFGVQWIWTAGVGAVAIYVLYARTRNLVATMILHLALNLPILIPTIADKVSA
jgi:membrane protease YdiL (CAAX protease family)